MRIISGNLKGKRIYFEKNFITRPLKDSVKENVFNIINHSPLIKTNIEKANILDLYSGVGSFGIECISRGASKVTFVEYDKGAANILKDNLANLSISNKSKVLNCKVEDALNKPFDEKFNFFFFDPPFKDFDFLKNLGLIKKKKLFKPNHLVIIHREAKIYDELNSFIKIIFEKEYGRSKIIFGFFT
tara:strand:- start:827 stop:1387 length:561 start_codon:yes stop_codon:yes gene_type:complete